LRKKIKKYREANKEILKIKKQEYVKTIDKKVKIQYLKDYRKENKELIKKKRKEKYEREREIIIDRKKKFYQNNKDKILKRDKNYYQNNKELVLERNKNWRENNKEKVDEYNKCRNCKLFYVRKENKFLCSYCNPDKTTRRKTKELKVKTFLEENNYKFIYNKKCNLDISCQTYFPDFLIDKGTFFLIIECDEDAHNSYDKDCERIRENNICFSLGLPCVFLRFNPDKKKIKTKTKQKILKSYIEYYKNKETCDNVVEYLFY